MVAVFTGIRNWIQHGKVIGHLQCELTPAVVIPWEKLIDTGVLDKEANAPPQLVKLRMLAIAGQLSRLTTFCPLRRDYICSAIKLLQTSMSARNSDQQNQGTSQSSENIEIPPIPKQTAGAVAGAAVGSIAGPIGAIVGGVAGALAGKAAKGRDVRQAGARTLRKIVTKAKSAKGTAKRQLSKASGKSSRKSTSRSRSSIKRVPSNRSTSAGSRKKSQTRRAASSAPASRNRETNRKKRH